MTGVLNGHLNVAFRTSQRTSLLRETFRFIVNPQQHIEPSTRHHTYLGESDG